MFKKITVSNFKAIGSPIELEIKPITLLFGPNSSGKSSIFQSLLYAYEVYKNNNLDPVHTDKGGSAVDLGGFKNIIHNHNLNNPIEYIFNLDVDYESLPDLDEFDDNNDLYELFGNFEKCENSIGITICWDKVFNKPIINKYSLVINNLPFVNIDFDNHPSLWGYYYSSVNLLHPIIPAQIKNVGVVTEHLNPAQNKDFIRSFDPTTSSRNITDYLPQKVFDEYSDRLFDNERNSYLFHDLVLYVFISRLIANLNDLIKEKLNSLIYLGPFRQIPERNFSPENFQTLARWAEGLAAWDVLYKDEYTVAETNSWLSKLGINYKIEVGKTVDIDESDINKLLYNQSTPTKVFENLKEQIDLYFDGKEESKEVLLMKIFNELKQLDNSKLKKYFDQAKTKLYLVPNDSNIKLQLHDLGVGIAQIVPIIVSVVSSQVKYGRTLLIEQPELHLHPAIQVELADLFASKLSKNGKPGVSLINPHYAILETHSEHLILRLLRRIEETTKNPQSDSNYKISPKDLVVYWFSFELGELVIEELPVDATGEFTKQWPNGFFEERSKELFPDD